ASRDDAALARAAANVVGTMPPLKRPLAFVTLSFLLVACKKPVEATADAATEGPAKPDASLTANAPAKPTPIVNRRAAATSCGPSPHGQLTRDKWLKGCSDDAECTKGKNGRCIRTMISHANFENACVYDQCSVDADCR